MVSKPFLRNRARHKHNASSGLHHGFGRMLGNEKGRIQILPQGLVPFVRRGKVGRL